MGGSGGGGGSAGAVSWPADVQDRYNALLGDFSGIDTATSTLIAAQSADPYVAAEGYDPDNQVQTFANAVQDFANQVANQTPEALWNGIVGNADARYNGIVLRDPVFVMPEPDSWLVMQEIWTFVESVLNASNDIAGAWDVPTTSASSDISGNWDDPTLNADTDIKADVAAASTISDAVTAYGNRLDDRISSDVLPRFEAGMRDINAVQSSAFVIGRAIIEGMADRDVASFDADLTYKAFLQRDSLLGQAHMEIDKLNAMNTDSKNKALVQSYLDSDRILAADTEAKNKLLSQAYLQDDQIRGEEAANANKLRAQALIQADKINADSDKAKSLINAEMSRHGTALIYQDADSYFKHVETNLDMWKAWAGYVVDSQRISYVMHKEKWDKDIEYNASSARWGLDMVQIAGNLVASISGGTSYTPGPTPAQNALGGAFSGAAIGARATGSAFGAGAGAILGGIGAYLMGGN